MSHFDDTLKSIARDHEQRRNADLREVLSTPAGRRAVWMLIEASGLYGEPPVEEPARSEWMGRRAFGLEIRKAFHEAAPQAFHEAEMEVERDRASDDERLKRAGERDIDEQVNNHLQNTTRR